MAKSRIFRDLIPMGSESEFKPPAPPANLRFTNNQMRKMISDYWQGPEKRAFFILHEWMKDLYNASIIKEVALRVTDIENKTKIDARWMSNPGDSDPSILNDLQQNPNAKYYVLERKFYDDATPNGRYRIGRVQNTEGIAARIGVKDGKFFLFFNSTKITYKRKGDGGIGNGGSGGGIQIPIT